MTRKDPAKIAESLTKKDWLKMIKKIRDPFYCEALITQLEARRRQLKPKFKSESPKG